MKIKLRKRQRIEVRGNSCSHIIHIKNNPKFGNLSIEYLDEEIDLAWIYSLISKYQSKINKKI